MSKRTLKKGFGVYFEPSKATSGRRFFVSLCGVLEKEAIPLDRRPTVILFNVSASIKKIIKAKWRRQKIVLRIDGLYFDRLSPRFVERFSWPLRRLLLAAMQVSWATDWFGFLGNLID